MNMTDVLMKKRNGAVLTDKEITDVINQYTAGSIPDYQMSAFLMTIYFNEMNVAERTTLTKAMMESGDVLDLSDIPGIKVDKHSTGGVGDKTSLPLAAMVAALDIKVPMISGRGLGHTGGTLDKLEAIPGLKVDLSEDAFKQQIRDVGTAIISATGEIAPADKKIYALRDVTCTVDSISLISSSIMSKKLATGNDALVLDVKTGSGAFMKNTEDARALAESMMEIGEAAGVKMRAVISDMNQPLGYEIGNALEIIETVETLKGNGPDDLVELCLALGAPMVVMAQKAPNEAIARKMLMQTLSDGSALTKFTEMIVAQGGDPAFIQDYLKLPTAPYTIPYVAKTAGKLGTIDADALGILVMQLGGGRATKDDTLDYGVGVTMHKKIGDAISVGEPILTVHANQPELDLSSLDEHIQIQEHAQAPTLIHATL
ncbi:pyrimidine-nucleoside phosphorylase [Weissella uvarum]|uniref:thymidine phosphorylase n=1 Tax=Weissella uvarum TaxID=1479233 RepID=UPI0019619694|nr:thymidine phosphorylase [Weissella uvarum]MBM7617409.1 pyrimidine-nucleoside phosphorylase [Weissella uvarum]MCM0595706.1 thymidine phosphorylase [Weissella uvarum]